MGKNAKLKRERFQYKREIKFLNDASTLYDYVAALEQGGRELVSMGVINMPTPTVPPIEAVIRYTEVHDGILGASGHIDFKKSAVDCRPPMNWFFVELVSSKSNSSMGVWVTYLENEDVASEDGQSKWQIYTEIAVTIKQRGEFLPCVAGNMGMLSFVDEYGRYIGHNEPQRRNLNNEYVEPEVNPAFPLTSVKALKNITATAHAQVLRLISTMNCRNVETVDHMPDPETSRLYEKHYGVPMTKFKTLHLRGERRSVNGSEPKEYQDLMPLHLRRGNAATYTDDAPLFGKFTGTFWRPATVVGSEKNGIVVKDYEVTYQQRYEELIYVHKRGT